MSHGEIADLKATGGAESATYEGNSIFMPQPLASKETGIGGKIAELRSFHAKQSHMCEQLEALADSLPDNVGNQECLMLARAIYPEIKRSHEFEENSLFPAARECDPDNLTLASTLERLRYEHWEDESFAEELTDALTSFVAEPECRNPEKLAYMLRGFFEGLRRHIAFEREHLIPLLMTFAERKS
jgi:hemerythrin-like domain-containing protein